jgi:N-acetylmuramoyl-L-alanine amidase
MLLVLGLLIAAAAGLGPPPGAPAPAHGTGTAIVVAGQTFEVGRPVVLWSDQEGFDAYQKTCIDQTGGCCDRTSPRYGERDRLARRALPALQALVSQLVLHFDGCVNSRSCFKSMHNRPRPDRGCGLSAHFMIDADGTIYQTLDLLERAFHAEQSNSISIGVEICNRGKVDRSEWPRLPAEYRTRPVRQLVINGTRHDAYEFRPEQYASLAALSKVLLRLFPHIPPVVPEKDGHVILDTLPDPLAFAGIVGHLHVDRQKEKWDPGALDWDRVLRPLTGFSFPLQLLSFTELPRTEAELLAARATAFHNAEERATAFFPVSAGRLWHSGVHLRGALGSPVRSPSRGRIVAARRGIGSFVLIRHEVEVEGLPFTFFSLLADLSLPEGLPWLHELGAAPDLQSGRVALLDRRVETGEVVGYLDAINRGPEQGPELHFEIFTADRPPGELGRSFRYLNASGDGPLVRRSDLVAALDGDGDQQIDPDELQRFFRNGDLRVRHALRRLAIRHRHEWGDRITAGELDSSRELAGLSAAQRRALYDTALAPYLFWTDALSRHAGLPANQIVYSYNPLTFLLALAAQEARLSLPRAETAEIGDAALEPRRLAHFPLEAWTSPRLWMAEAPLFGPPVGMKLKPRKKSDIPLIPLPPTDNR